MIWEAIILPFADFGFMRRALLGCIAISVGATPVGVFLMLRRMSLTGDAMAHAILPGAAIGYLIAGLSLGARRRQRCDPRVLAHQVAGGLVARPQRVATQGARTREHVSNATH